MNKKYIALAGAGVGAGLMYLADPASGRRRRAEMRDAAVHASHAASATAEAASRDAGNRWRGVVARAADWLIGQRVPGDDVLAARVRARLGRLVLHPRGIDVSATAGIVTLSGPIAATEIEQLLDGVSDVRGVAGVINHLKADAEPSTPQHGARIIGKRLGFGKERKMKIQQIMTTPARSCRPDSNLAEAVMMMWNGDCGVLPVVDADGKVVGMLTDRDVSIAVGTRGRPADAIAARDVMTGKVYSCSAFDDVSTVLQTLKEQHIRRLPVVDAEGRLAGIVSLNDIVLHPDAASAAEIAGTFRSICEHRGPVPVPHAA